MVLRDCLRLQEPGAYEGRDGYVGKPRYATRTQMNKARHDSHKADTTFDIDGDGTVSNKDFLLASKFDVDKDGTIDPEERIHLRTAMVQDTVNKFREFQAAGAVGFDAGKVQSNLHQHSLISGDVSETASLVLSDVEELMEAFTNNLDEAVHSEAFGSMLQRLMVKTNVTDNNNSLRIHKIMQQPRKRDTGGSFMVSFIYK